MNGLFNTFFSVFLVSFALVAIRYGRRSPISDNQDARSQSTTSGIADDVRFDGRHDLAPSESQRRRSGTSRRARRRRSRGLSIATALRLTLLAERLIYQLEARPPSGRLDDATAAYTDDRCRIYELQTPTGRHFQVVFTQQRTSLPSLEFGVRGDEQSHFLTVLPSATHFQAAAAVDCDDDCNQLMQWLGDIVGNP